MGRTSKNIKFRIPEKPRKIKGFRNGGFPIATTISSPGRCRLPHQRFQNVHDLIVFDVCRVSKLLAVFLPHGAQLRIFFDIS